VAAALMEYVDYPDVNLPSRDYTEPEQITNEDIEEAACECRDLWRLGRSAIQDLALAVEGAGVILVREETGVAQIEGLSAWSEVLGRPLILLSADKDIRRTSSRSGLGLVAGAERLGRSARNFGASS